MRMEEDVRRYRLISANGIAAIIIRNKKVLLLKRRNVPLLKNRGIWSFLFGGKEQKEAYIETAYREIHEEVGLEKKNLIMLGSGKRVLLFDKRAKIRWYNYLFVFRAKTGRIKMDYENSGYRWASLDEIANERKYTNIFINERLILDKIKGNIDGRKGFEKQDR